MRKKKKNFEKKTEFKKIFERKKKENFRKIL